MEQETVLFREPTFYLIFIIFGVGIAIGVPIGAYLF